MVRDLVLSGREPGGVGRTIRCVDRGVAPIRPVLKLVTPVRGTAIGWVVAVPDDIGEAGIKPVGCDTLAAGKKLVDGGV